MPYLLTRPEALVNILDVFGWEPEIPPSPWLASMLAIGRASTDPPGIARRLTPEQQTQLPTVVHAGKPRSKGVPDVIHVHAPIVSRRLRAIIEELEPGRHDFYPIRIECNGSRKEIGEYFILHLRQFPDVIDFENTLFVSKEGGRGDHRYGLEAAMKNRFRIMNIIWKKPASGQAAGHLIAFKPGALEGLHLWRGTVGPFENRWEVTRGTPKYPELTMYHDPLEDLVFASDELVSRMKQEKIFGWDARKIIEKPPGWYYEARGTLVL
jgi:hypothetical protein